MPSSFCAFCSATWIWLTHGSSIGVEKIAATFSGSAERAGPVPIIAAKLAAIKARRVQVDPNRSAMPTSPLAEPSAAMFAELMGGRESCLFREVTAGSRYSAAFASSLCRRFGRDRSWLRVSQPCLPRPSATCGTRQEDFREHAGSDHIILPGGAFLSQSHPKSRPSRFFWSILDPHLSDPR